MYIFPSASLTITITKPRATAAEGREELFVVGFALQQPFQMIKMLSVFDVHEYSTVELM